MLQLKRSQYAFSQIIPVLLIVGGCGASSTSSEYHGDAKFDSPSVVAPTEIAFADTEISELGDSPDKEIASPVERKIIYEAQLVLEVTNFDTVPKLVKDAVSTVNGYIANSNIEGASGGRRHGTWTIKIPTTRYEEFLRHAESIGELQSITEDTTEVTAEYYDLEARIRTKQQEEQRMLKHLEEDTNELKDTLAVEKELTRIRTELERFQGQMKLLSHRVDFSTVTLTVTEYRIYAPNEQIGFIPEIQRAWSSSIKRIGTFLRSLVVAIVAFAPWLVLLGIPTYFVVMMLRGKFKVKTLT